ncbi:unnamed protein product, partial [Pylaiella littoralis]
ESRWGGGVESIIFCRAPFSCGGTLHTQHQQDFIRLYIAPTRTPGARNGVLDPRGIDQSSNTHTTYVAEGRSGNSW